MRPAKMSGVSFKLPTGKGAPKLRPGGAALGEAAGSGEAGEAEAEVELIEGDFLTRSAGTKAGAKAAPLVIPLITKNRWRVEEVRVADPVKAELVEREESELEKAARAALIADSARLEEGPEGAMEEEEPSTSAAIPLLYANAVPTGFETDDKLDVSLRYSPSNSGKRTEG